MRKILCGGCMEGFPPDLMEEVGGRQRCPSCAAAERGEGQVEPAEPPRKKTAAEIMKERARKARETGSLGPAGAPGPPPSDDPASGDSASPGSAMPPRRTGADILRELGDTPPKTGRPKTGTRRIGQGPGTPLERPGGARTTGRLGDTPIAAASSDSRTSPPSTSPGGARVPGSLASGSLASGGGTAAAAAAAAGAGVAGAAPMPRTPSATSEDIAEFIGRIGEAFGYPFQGSGIAMMILGGLFFSFLAIIGNTMLYASIILLIISNGYYFLFLQKIVHTTVRGSEEVPGWPTFTSFFDSALNPCLQLVGTVLFCLAPALVYGVVFRGFFLFVSPLFWYLCFLGYCYAWMALLAVTLFGSISSITPRVVVPSIAIVPVPYVLLLVMNIGIELIGGVIIFAFQAALGFFPLGWMAGIVVGTIMLLYIRIVQFRFLGLLYYDFQERLQWFRH